MKFPKIENAPRYAGLYIVDFGDHCGVGFLAEEVAELLESERFQHITVYKIYNAYPDGTLEITGVRKEIFHQESGMFFYAFDEETVRADFARLSECPHWMEPPSRAKIHLAEVGPQQYATALIYPAEYDAEFSRWLLDCQYRTEGPAAGGVSAVEQYYSQKPVILESTQIFNSTSAAFHGENLLEAAKKVMVR